MQLIDRIGHVVLGEHDLVRQLSVFFVLADDHVCVGFELLGHELLHGESAVEQELLVELDLEVVQQIAHLLVLRRPERLLDFDQRAILFLSLSRESRLDV